jgi:hypothetical protein
VFLTHPVPKKPRLARTRAKKKIWYIIDVEKREETFKQARLTQDLPMDILWHDGKLLHRLQDVFVVAKVPEAVSERQARYLASNGRTEGEAQKHERCGHRKNKFFDPTRYLAVEQKVWIYWLDCSKIEWHVLSARLAIYDKYGPEVLPDLCPSFVPTPRSAGDIIAHTSS